MKNILEIRNLSHAYDQASSIIKDFNFSLKKGEIVSILGPSGIGKTTLLRIVAGLEDVMDGEVIISEKVASKKNFLLLNKHFLIHKTKYHQGKVYPDVLVSKRLIHPIYQKFLKPTKVQKLFFGLP